MITEATQDSGHWPSDTQPESWIWLNFSEALLDFTDSKKKLQERDYLAEGRHPVIDQGKKLVSGYTNSTELLYSGPLPVIVFGDHTRCVKWIDQPFAQGADGVKVLSPQDALLPRFAFWALRTIQLPDKGYSRHFKFLKASKFPAAPLNEQRRIVAKLDALFEKSRSIREKLDRLPRLLANLQKSILNSAFRGDLTKEWRANNPNVEPASELLKRIRAERRAKWEADLIAKGKDPKKAKYVEPEPVDTEGLPELPDGWCWVGLAEICYQITDGEHISPTRLQEGVPLLTAKNVTSHGVTFNNVDYVSEEDAERFWLRCRPEQYDILVCSRGTIGRSAIISEANRFCLMGTVILLKPSPDRVLADFLFKFLNSPLAMKMMKEASGASAVSALYLRDIATLPVPLAPLSEQAEISKKLSAQIDLVDQLNLRSDAQNEKQKLLEQSILAKAFRGELVPQDPNDEPASVLLERIRAQKPVAGTKRGRGRKAAA